MMGSIPIWAWKEKAVLNAILKVMRKNEQELEQSDGKSHPQNQDGK